MAGVADEEDSLAAGLFCRPLHTSSGEHALSRASSLKRRCRPYKGTLTSPESGGAFVRTGSLRYRSLSSLPSMPTLAGLETVVFGGFTHPPRADGDPPSRQCGSLGRLPVTRALCTGASVCVCVCVCNVRGCVCAEREAGESGTVLTYVDT
jgi:hypothetical protein